MTLKVLSLNLWSGGRLFDQIVEFLRTERADIMCLQEAYDGKDPQIERRLRTVTELSQAFPQYHVSFAPVYQDTRAKEGLIEEGQLLLSRYPITQTENVFFDIPYATLDQDSTTDFSQWPATLQHCQLNVEDQILEVMNVHGPVNLDGVIDSDRRLRMSYEIVDRLKVTSNLVIVIGDFNVRPHTKTIRNIEAYLSNVFANELSTTFNMQHKTNPGYASSVVDMMFVSPSIKVISHHQSQVDLSDHLPLIAEIEI